MNIGYLTSKNGGLFEMMNESGLFGKHNFHVFVDRDKPKLIERCLKYRTPLIQFNTERELNGVLKATNTDLVFSAGYLKLLSEEFVEDWYNKIVNIHPGPRGYEGIHPQRAVHNDRRRYVGQNIHILDKTMDLGESLHYTEALNRFPDTDSMNQFLKEQALRPLADIFDNWDTIAGCLE